MIIKVVDDGSSPLIGKTIAYNNREIKINDENKDAIKDKLDEGRKILIKKDGEFIDGSEYFTKKTSVDAEVDFVDDYDDLFEGHWKKQVKKIQEYSDNPTKIEDVLEYAEENDVSDAVIERVEDYLSELGQKE